MPSSPYCWEVRPLLARSWSAAAHRRFSRVSVAASLSDGAIQCIRPEAWYFKSFQPQMKMTTAGMETPGNHAPGQFATIAEDLK